MEKFDVLPWPKEIDIDLLVEHTTSVHSIKCSKCGKVIEYDLTPYVKDAANYFYGMGWKVKKGMVYCPKDF